MHRFAAIILTAVVLAAGAGSALAEARIALVIGNSEYAQSPLANPVNDARLMTAALRAQGFEVIERLDVGQIDMKLAVTDFAKRLEAAGRDAVGLFYYAGHGVQVGGENYLVPVGAPIENESHVDIYAVGASAILASIAFAGNRLNIVILDACRNNPYARSFRSPVRGLAVMRARTGTLIAYATAPGQVALDGEGDNSPYTAALAAAIAEPGVPLEQMFKRVRDAVLGATQGRQTPWEASSLTGADFYFVPPQPDAETAVAPAPAPGRAESPGFDARALDLAFWDSIKDGEDPADFKDYLSRFPEGMFSGLARRRLKELEETEVAVVTPPPQPAAVPKRFGIDERDEMLVAIKTANVRSGPSTEHEQIAQLHAGSDVLVTGKVEGRDWYRIALASGGVGFVWAPLLGEAEEIQTAAVVVPSPAPAGPQPPSAGTTFSDCAECPEMVVVPAGSFMMGSPESEEGRWDDEGPVHQVRIAQRFAIGKYEVTFAEWDACVAAGGCSHRPADEGWGRGTRPVINVSWDDAKEYVRWLGSRTGHEYRLPSEAEWEYAARAGTETPRYWGNAANGACGYANVHDETSKRENEFDWEHYRCDDGYAETAPVGSFGASRFGLYDVLGNVLEWVEDCWHDNYGGALVDGSAWTSGGCGGRVLRGGSWGNGPRLMRSAVRGRDGTGYRDFNVGFRVARTLF